MSSKELETLFAQESTDLKKWIGRGYIPKHYKRLSCSEEEAMRLAKYGFKQMAMYFEESLFFTQSVIAGAVLSKRYNKITIITPSTYGKSFLMGRLGILLARGISADKTAGEPARDGEPTYVVAAVQDGTKMIMGHVVAGLQTAAPEIRRELLNKKDQIEKLATSVSKTKVAFSKGGFVEPITTGDTYDNNLSNNKAIGKPGNYLVDEAALVSDDSFGELGRAELAKVDGSQYKLVMISNPHKVGFFYDSVTEEDLADDEIVIWMDALTAVEEGRITKQKVFRGTFAKHVSTLRRYLLCILDNDGEGMFSTPKTYEPPYEGDYIQYFMGVDAAYKGKDSIYASVVAVGGGKIHAEKIYEIKKPKSSEWIDGVTTEDIIRQITRIARENDVAMACLDVGWGVWLLEGLLRHGVNVRGINFSEAPSKDRVKARHYSATNAVNKRAEMHLDFQDLVENDILEVSPEVLHQIADALPYITSERKNNGKIAIRPKSEVKAIIGHSPDELDSLLLSIQAVIQFLGDSVYAIT